MEHQVAMESLQDATAWLKMVVAGERPDEAVPEDPIELVPSVTTAPFRGRGAEERRAGHRRLLGAVVRAVQAGVADRRDDRRDAQGLYKVVKVNIDEEPTIAEEYGVQSIPMIGLFRNGRLERSSVGAKPRPQLEAELGMLVIP